jgi:hypothetical protein
MMEPFCPSGGVDWMNGHTLPMGASTEGVGQGHGGRVLVELIEQMRN